MGMTPVAFYSMRVGEFWEALAAYRENQMQERRHSAELVRGATMILFNVQVQKKYRVKDPAKFWRMPWDKADDGAEDREIKRLMNLSPEEQAEEARKFFERTKQADKWQTQAPTSK